MGLTTGYCLHMVTPWGRPDQRQEQGGGIQLCAPARSSKEHPLAYLSVTTLQPEPGAVGEGTTTPPHTRGISYLVGEHLMLILITLTHTHNMQT